MRICPCVHLVQHKSVMGGKLGKNNSRTLVIIKRHTTQSVISLEPGIRDLHLSLSS